MPRRTDKDAHRGGYGGGGMSQMGGIGRSRSYRTMGLSEEEAAERIWKDSRSRVDNRPRDDCHSWTMVGTKMIVGPARVRARVAKSGAR